MRAIEVSNLTKSYGKQVVLDDISFHIDEGEIVGFIGPNGAGKSTLMKCICNLIPIDQGSISIFGKDLIRDREEALSLQSSLIEGPGLFENLSGWQNLDLFASLKNVTKERMQEMADYTGLGKQLHKQTGAYSVGMKQRLALAIALLNEPKFMMLDEPMNGLDPAGVLELRRELKQMVERDHMTLLISSHQLNEIEKIADRIIYINEGKINKIEKEELKHLYHFKLDKAIDNLPLPGSPVFVEDNIYEVTVQDESEFADLILALSKQEVRILEITAVQKDLEDEYRRIYEVKP